MSGPFIPARAGQPFDLLEKGAAGGGWDGLEEIFKPVLQDAPLQPGDDIARFLWGLANTPQGRAMFEWMMDISIRQPFRGSEASRVGKECGSTWKSRVWASHEKKKKTKNK